MMIELSKLKEAPFETKAKLVMPEGEPLEVRVIYRPITPKILRDAMAVASDPERTIEDQAVLLVKELPDLADKGKPVKITRELFEGLDMRHVSAIVEAVMGDFAGATDDGRAIPTEEGNAREAREQAEREAAAAQPVG